MHTDTNSTSPPPSDASDLAPASNPSADPTTNSLLEKLVLEQIAERRHARRSRLGWRILWVIAFIAIGWMLFGKGCSSMHSALPHTAVIEIEGEIAGETNASAKNIIESLKAAFEESSAQAVVLVINSPGGSPVQAGIVSDEIHQLKIKYPKPLYVVVEESCASAAYYIAVAADRIYVDKASIVGSIGVLMDGFGFTGLMDKVGVERRLMIAGENKGFLDPFSPQSTRQKAYAQEMLNQVHRQFIEVVKKGRGARLKETPETFSGLFWSGAQAVEMGLADGFANVDRVAREVVKAEMLVDYTKRENVAEQLVKGFGEAVGHGTIQALQGRHLRIQ